MLSRFATVFSVILFGSLFRFVHAAAEEMDKLRIGNETIDRVRMITTSLMVHLVAVSCIWMRSTIHLPCLLRILT